MTPTNLIPSTTLNDTRDTLESLKDITFSVNDYLTIMPFINHKTSYDIVNVAIIVDLFKNLTYHKCFA